MSKRKSISQEIQTELLVKSARRCCLCFGLSNDTNIKKGQIAHIDRNNSNSAFDNLAFLCLEHHDAYDSKTSQSKGFTSEEVSTYNRRLFTWVEISLPAQERVSEYVAFEESKNERVMDTANRLFEIGLDSPNSIAKEAIQRLVRYVACFDELLNAFEALPDSLPDEARETEYLKIQRKIYNIHEIPRDVYGMSPEGPLDPNWVKMMNPQIKKWADGICSHSECGELLWELDERYDFDQFYILFGLSHGTLDALQMRFLDSLVYKFGIRNMP